MDSSATLLIIFSVVVVCGVKVFADFRSAVKSLQCVILGPNTRWCFLTPYILVGTFLARVLYSHLLVLLACCSRIPFLYWLEGTIEAGSVNILNMQNVVWILSVQYVVFTCTETGDALTLSIQIALLPQVTRHLFVADPAAIKVPHSPRSSEPSNVLTYCRKSPATVLGFQSLQNPTGYCHFLARTLLGQKGMNGNAFARSSHLPSQRLAKVYFLLKRSVT